MAILAYCLNIRAKPCCVETYKNARPAQFDLDFCYSDYSDDDNSKSERKKMIIGTSRAMLVDCILSLIKAIKSVPNLAMIESRQFISLDSSAVISLR